MHCSTFANGAAMSIVLETGLVKHYHWTICIDAVGLQSHAVDYKTAPRIF